MAIKRRTKRVDDVTVPTASMSDIAFLLIIFFILTSVFAKDTPAELDKHKSADIQKLEEVPETIIAVDKFGDVWVRQSKLDSPEMLPETLEQIFQNVQGADREALLYIDKNSKDRKTWDQVMEALSEAGVTFQLGALPTSDKGAPAP